MFFLAIKGVFASSDAYSLSSSVGWAPACTRICISPLSCGSLLAYVYNALKFCEYLCWKRMLSDFESQIRTKANRSFHALGGPWSIGAILIALIVLTPIFAVIYLAFFPTQNIWPHLISTTLPRYFTTTVGLMVSVGFWAALIGTATAWIVSRYQFSAHAGWNGYC